MYGEVGMDGGLVLRRVVAVQNSGRAPVITLYQCMEVAAAAAVRSCPPPAIPLVVQVMYKLDAVIKTVIPARKCLPLNMKYPVT